MVISGGTLAYLTGLAGRIATIEEKIAGIEEAVKPAPKPLKTFVDAQTYDFVTDIDPAYSFSGEIIAMANVYETLLVYTGVPEVTPALATDYEVSEDGLTWNFSLREGVSFHDGTHFNATAVKYSIDRIIELGSGPVFIWDPLEEIKIIDEYTVQFILTYAAPLQRIISSAYGAWIYSPKTAEIEDLHDWFNEGNDAGTGPYMIESLERAWRRLLLGLLSSF